MLNHKIGKVFLNAVEDKVNGFFLTDVNSLVFIHFQEFPTVFFLESLGDFSQIVTLIKIFIKNSFNPAQVFISDPG